MAYREDKDLEFLRFLSDEQLEQLVTVLIKDDSGETRTNRLTERLTKSKGYKKYAPKGKHSLYWQDIAEEIQRRGANSIATVFRGGKGVLYKELLTDVAKKLKVEYIDEDSSVSEIEHYVLLKLFESAIENVDYSDLKEIALKVNLPESSSLFGNELVQKCADVFKLGGDTAASLSVYLGQAIEVIIGGRIVAVSGRGVLARAVGLATGPVGWAALGVWTAVDLASPAYRVTIPAVVCIATLRNQFQLDVQKRPWYYLFRRAWPTIQSLGITVAIAGAVYYWYTH